MPRVPQLKCHLRFHPANSAATNAIRRPFKYDVHQKQTNLQRLLVALHVTRPTVPVALEDMLEQISAQAADNEEVLGCRWNLFVHVALSVLRKNGYLELQVREDGVEYCWLTEDGMRIMRDADVGLETCGTTCHLLRDAEELGNIFNGRFHRT